MKKKSLRKPVQAIVDRIIWDQLRIRSTIEDRTDLIQTLHDTAARITEILKLEWADINFEQRWIRLWTRKRRGGELQDDKLEMTGRPYLILKRRWDTRDKSTPYVFRSSGWFQTDVRPEEAYDGQAM